MQKRRPIITPRRMMSTHQRAMPVKEEPKVVAVEVTASDQSEGDESEELELSDASSVENEEEESEDEGRSGEQFTESSNESEEGEEGQEGEAGGGEKEGEEVDDEENEIADKEELATPASIKEVEITNTKPASPLSTASPQSTMWNNAIGTLGLFSIRKASVSVADNARAPDLLVVPHQGELTAPASNDISRSSSFVSAVDMESESTSSSVVSKIPARTSSRQSLHPLDSGTSQSDKDEVVSRLTKELTKANDELEKSRSTMQSLMANKGETELRLVELETQNSKSDETIQELLNELKDKEVIMDRHKALSQELANVKQGLEVKTAELEKTSTELKTSRLQEGTWKETRDKAIKAEQETTEKIITELRSKIDQLEADRRTESSKFKHTIDTLQENAKESVEAFTRIKTLEADLKSESEEKMKLCTRLSEMKEELNKSENSNVEASSLKEKLEAAQKGQFEAEETVISLKETLRTLEATLKSSQDLASALNQQLLNLQVELKDSQIQRDKLASKAEELQLAMNSKTEEMEKSYAKLDAMAVLSLASNQELSATKSELNKALDSLSVADDEISDLKMELETKHQEFMSMAFQLKAKTDESAEVQKTLASKNHEIDSYKNQIFSLESEIALHGAKLYQLQNNTVPQSRKTQAQDVMAAMELDLRGAKSRLDALMTENQTLTEALTIFETQLADSKSKLQKSRVEKVLRATRVSEIWTECQAARKELDATKEILSKVTKELLETKEQLNLQQKLPDRTEDVDAVRVEMQGRINECIESFRSENQKWNEKKGQLKAIHGELEMEITNLRAEILALKATAFEANKSKEELSTQLNRKEEEIKHFLTAADEARQLSEDLHEELRKSQEKVNISIEQCKIIESLRDQIKEKDCVIARLKQVPYEKASSSQEPIQRHSLASFTSQDTLVKNLPALNLANQDSLMGDVLSALIRQNSERMSVASDVLQEPDSDKKWWMEEWMTKGAPTMSQKTLLEISDALGFPASDEEDSLSVKKRIIDEIQLLKGRVGELETLCRELTELSHESLEAAKKLDAKYVQAQNHAVAKDEVIHRLHNVLEGGASVIGRRRLSSLIAVARVASRAPGPPK